METKTDRVTPVARERNPTAFAYWNVASAGSGVQIFVSFATFCSNPLCFLLCPARLLV
jgi:hypothetical protein